jgi:multiple sugar transport system substrate-binding protein
MTPTPRRPYGLSRRGFLGMSGMAAAAGLVGCGGESVGGSGSSAQLQFMMWGSTFEKAAIQTMMDGFEKAHKGTSVKIIYVPGDYETKVNTLVASNTMPDVAYMTAPTAYRLAGQGKIKNIYPYIKKYPVLADRSPENFFWYGDKKVAGTPGASEITLLWYNRDMIKDPSLKPPAAADQAWSWDQMVQAATQLTFDQNGKHPTESGFDPKNIKQFGISAPLTTQWTWYPLMRSNGADVADETGMKYTMNSPESVKVFQDLQDLVYKHHVSPSPAQLGGANGANAPSTTVLLQTKRVAMVIDGQWTLLDLGQSNLNYGVGVLPSYQQPMTQQAGSCRILSSGTKHLNDAVDLYVWSVDGSHSDLFAKGLWMPVQTKYYSSEAAVKSWTDNKVHPPEFRTAAVDYRVNNSVRDWTQLYKNAVNLTEVITPAIEEISTGKTPAKQVLDALEAKVQPLLQGKYTIPTSM